MTRLDAIAAACRAARNFGKPYFVFRVGMEGYFYGDADTVETFYADYQIVFTTGKDS